MEQPLVLVIIPLYNARPFIKAAIDSILGQTYRNIRLLVINDGSTDGCEKIVEEYPDARILLWHQENQGPGAAMNRAIQYAHEHQIEFIARMDADDISLPQRIETQVHLLLTNLGVAACSANCYYIDPISEKIIGTSTVSTNQKLIRWEINHGLRGLIQGALLCRTDPLRNVGYYRSTFPFAEETDLFLRLIESYEVMNTDRVLMKIRINPGSLSMRNIRDDILYQFYALDCARRRKHGLPEAEYKQFMATLSPIMKFRIWREETLLKLWRQHMGSNNPIHLILAGIVDPRRVLIRMLRFL